MKAHGKGDYSRGRWTRMWDGIVGDGGVRHRVQLGFDLHA
jgi:hypothetical protein